MSRGHGPFPRSSLTQNGQTSVRGPSGLAPVFHSGTAQRPSSPTRTVRGDAAGRRTTPCPTTAATAANLNTHGQPTSANATPTNACNDNHQTHRTRERSRFRINARADALDDLCGGGVVRSTAPQKIRVQRGIRQLQNRFERAHFRVRHPRSKAIEEGHQQSIDFPHAAPATPPHPRKPSVHRTLP
jgi:hypothetical protein